MNKEIKYLEEKRYIGLYISEKYKRKFEWKIRLRWTGILL